MPNPGEKILIDLYYAQDRSLQKIGNIYGVSRERVRQWMEAFHLSRNRVGRKNLLEIKSNLNIYDEYIRGEPVAKLAKKNKMSANTIYAFLLKCNPNIRLEKTFQRRNEGYK